MLVFGQDSSVSRLVSKLFLVTESRYSRQQESAADRFGLDLLVNSFGHAAGATDFFRRVGEKTDGRIPYLLASHPHPDDRIDALQQLIAEKEYRVEEVTALGEDLQSELKLGKKSALQTSAPAVED